MTTKKTRSPKKTATERKLLPPSSAECYQRRLERAALMCQDGIELLTDALLEKPKRVNLTSLRSKIGAAQAHLSALDSMLDEVT